MILICDTLNGDDQQKCNNAIEFTKKNKKLIISTFADISKHPQESNPISVFMAGSPGAGKTEFSKRLISELKNKKIITTDPVRIDPDDLRELLPGYTGNNSHIFQAASSVGVEKLYDHVIKNRLSAIIDGTFASKKSIENIERSIKKNRPVEIFFIYQDPKLAWEFTKKREKLEKRNIPKEAFIDAFFASKDNVNSVKKHYGDKVKLNLVIKNFDTNLEELKLNIDNIDHYIHIPYTKDELQKIIL
jgi:UDP-N-acetylglucosamine kinase